MLTHLCHSSRGVGRASPGSPDESTQWAADTQDGQAEEETDPAQEIEEEEGVEEEAEVEEAEVEMEHQHQQHLKQSGVSSLVLVVMKMDCSGPMSGISQLTHVLGHNTVC